MKTSKINFRAIALVSGLVIAFAGSAFTSKTPVYWHLKEEVNINDDLFDADNYEEGTSTGCDEGAALPCVITFDSTSDIETYLSSFGNDKQELMDDAANTRSN